jgi:hypothetical protein
MRYQLCARDQHTGYVFFDNNCTSNRFRVVCTIRKLPTELNETLKQKIVERHGSGMLIRRAQHGQSVADVQLEFFKYCIVLQSGEPTVIYDIELGTQVYTSSERALKKMQCDNQRQLAISRSDDRAQYRDINFTTDSHGTVTLTMATYEDPNDYCGITIAVEKPVTKQNAYGAFVRATNPRSLFVKKWLRLPTPISPAQVLRINSSDFYTQMDVAYETKQDGYVTERILWPRKTRAPPSLPSR